MRRCAPIVFSIRPAASAIGRVNAEMPHAFRTVIRAADLKEQ